MLGVTFKSSLAYSVRKVKLPGSSQGSYLRRRLFDTHFLRMSTIPDDSTSKAKGKGKGKKEVESKYSSTVLLPKTTFDQRANSVKREPEIQKFWADNDIYGKVSNNNQGEKFILHDGPPYANGNLHIGHALNKILKDFINRYQLLRGKKVSYVPGWDCHGLPIEMKVLQTMKASEKEGMTPSALRKKAAQFAKDTVIIQKESFKRYGVWGDWDQPYLTLENEYEAAQIRVFGSMVEKGHIYRGKKPVHWSPSSRTALAEAELEYPENHISRSIYVGFQATQLSSKLNELGLQAKDVRVAIWTTTPWTIPGNLAVAVNGDLDYCVASNPAYMNGSKFIVAKDLLATFQEKVGHNLTLEHVVKGNDLIGTKYQHPLYDRVSDVIIGGDYITTDSGTGLVHTAPGHGQEDYITGQKYGLPLLSPVDDAGKFTSEVGEKFQGMDVLGDGNKAIITALNETGTLLREEAYNHKYPYDWRTKKPTIFRATEQWFASVSSFREDALKAVDTVQWIPAIGRNRLTSMIESRGDWCISRQRSWGVPIPVFYKKSSGEPLMTKETLKHIEDVFREKGSDAWWDLEIQDLLPSGPLRAVAEEYYKGTDTMDVWFDSGTSWAGVVQGRKELSYPADIYLEGSDQHRGWFQSSLLTSVASQGIAPYKTVLTHGFVLDEKGYKMSKSLGNVVDPKDVIEGGANQKEKPAYGADTLRLWVSSVDYSGDVCVGENIMKQMSDGYRKIRNTLRFLVGSLNDFDPSKDMVKYDELPSIDKFMLGKLSTVVTDVENAYDDYQFYKVNQALLQLCNIDLSSFYLDISKDRLYISSQSDHRRKSCQTVLYIMMEQIAVMLAPLLPHLSEDLWQNFPIKPTNSVFERGWIKPNERFPAHKEDSWNLLLKVRDDVNGCLEKARQAKLIGASQEAHVKLFTSDPTLLETLKSLESDDKILPKPVKTNGMDDLRFILLASKISIEKSEDDIANSCSYVTKASESLSGAAVGVVKAGGKKCERCWYYCESVGEAEHKHDDLCKRCNDVIARDGYKVETSAAVSQ